MSSPEKETTKETAATSDNNKCRLTLEASSNTISSNPILVDDNAHTDDLERLRGDAIGDTMYSERFVLSTLLKLANVKEDLSKDEEFENDLCALWDMTIEEDVVKLLLEHNVMELFAQCIDVTTDKRLTEILIGIIGNMCNVQEARENLSANGAAIATLLGLVGCSDSLTLLQLMRLLSVVLIHADRDAAVVWYQHVCATPNFVLDISFILNNCMNEALLRQTLETLNAILAKFALIDPQQLRSKASGDNSNVRVFHELFVEQTLVKGTTIAFEMLLPKQKKTINVDDDAVLPTQNTRNMMQIFLNIHSILTQYDELSQACYAPHMTALFECLSRILEPLCDSLYMPHMSNHEQNMLESINDIFEALNDPFDERCFVQLILLWNVLRQENEMRARRSPPSNEFEDDDTETENDDFRFEDGYMTVLDFITRQAQKRTVSQLQRVVNAISTDIMDNLLGTLSASVGDKSMKLSYEKFYAAVQDKKDKENNKT